MIKGIPVTLYERVQTGVDAFNAPVYTETPVVVSNVLVTPASIEEDVISSLQLYGRRIAYELSIPKGDTHSWEGNRVDFYGQSFRAYTPVEEWTEANVPLRWNRKVRVEKIE